MSDIDFIRLLTTLTKRKSLTQKTAVNEAQNYFPDYEKPTIRNLVVDRLKVLEKNNLEKVFHLLKDVYEKLYDNTEIKRTLDHHYTTDIRGVISRRFGDGSPEHKMSKDICKLKWVDKGNLIKDNSLVRDTKFENMKHFTSASVFSSIEENIKDKNPIKRAIALGLACGSRPVELLAKSTYTAIDDVWVKQDFIAKSKSRDSLEKPILYLSASQFVEEVEKMRKEINKKYKNKILVGNQDEDQEQLNGTIDSALNVMAKKILGDEENFTTTRKQYIKLSHHLIGQHPNRLSENGMGDRLWEQRVLGHKQGDMDTSANYSNYKHKETTDTELVVKVEVLEDKVEDIEEVLETGAPLTTKTEKEPKAPVVISNKTERQFEALETIFEKYKKEHKDKEPTQNEMEALAKGLVPRAVVRTFMAKKRLASLY